MKTAFLTATVSRLAGGLFVSVRRLAQTLSQGGEVEVSVLALRDEHTDSDLERWSPLVPQVSDPRGPRAFGYSAALRRQLEQVDPDLVHVHGLWMYPSLACLNWHRRRRRPYLVSPRGMLDPWALASSRWKKNLAGWCYEKSHLRSAACLHALCDSEARSIRAYGLRNPICVIPNGIDLPGVDENGKQKAESRNPPWQGRVEPGRKVLLYLGRIHPKKGLINLLKAWAAVQRTEDGGQRAAEWVLAVAGWDQGGHESELKRLATDLGIPWADARGKAEVLKTEMRKGANAQSQEPGAHFSVSESQRFGVLFLGPQFGAAKTACYRACDAFILPSFSEGLPMVVLEAWANTKPVLMTPQCNLPEGFAAGAALRIEPGVESVAEGLQQLLGMSGAQREAMAQKGRALARDRFAWPCTAAQMKHVYEWVLGGGTKPDCVVL